MNDPLASGPLVFDSSPLNYFARSGQLQVLEKLIAGRRCLITPAVEEEILRGAARYSRLHQVLSQPWLEVDPTTPLEMLILFSEYHSSLGGGTKDVGEATTLAYAEFHGYVAVVDDKAARSRAKYRGRGTQAHSNSWWTASASPCSHAPRPAR